MESLNMEFERTADATTLADTKTGAKTYHFVNEYENDRTIDYDTGAYLVYEGGGGGGYDSPGKRFTFHWQGEKIPFNAGLDESFDENGKRNIKWSFSVMGIPYHMDDQYDEIVEMVKQALEVHGYIYRREKYQKVDVEYIKPIPYEI